MKFSNILAFAGLACAAVTKFAPVERDIKVIEERDTSVVDTVLDIVETLDEATKGNLAAITKAVEEVSGDVGAIPAEIIAIIKENYESITESLKEAGDAIADITEGAVEDIANGVSDLTQAQIELLKKAVESVKSIVSNIEVTLEFALSDLTPAILKAINAELKAVKEALAPFVKPLAKFVNDILDVAATLKLTVTGLQNALNELGGLLESILDFVGVPEIIDIIFG